MKLDTNIMKVAADQLDALGAKVASLTAELASTKEAKVASVQAAQKPSPELVKVAQAAGEQLFAKGLLSSAHKRDEFVAKIAADPMEAIQALAKIAGHVPEPQVRKLGSADESEAPSVSPLAASEARWASRLTTLRANK